MDKIIYLIRHGKIDLGNEKVYIGSTDIPLSSEGVQQSKLLKKYFANIDIQKAYTSPLIRCVKTLDIILEDRNNIDRIYVKEFQEIDLGKWENKTFKYIKSHFPQEYEERGKNIDTFVPENGESFYQLQNRVMPIVNKILETKDNNILIVSHAGANRVIISNLLKIPLKDIMGIYQPYACINKLFWNSKVKKWEYELITMGEEVL